MWSRDSWKRERRGYKRKWSFQTQQRAALLKKANDYARAVNCSPLSRRGANTFYRGIYQLSVGYVLPLTYFTNKELNQIQKQAHRAFVAKCGYNRNTNLAVVWPQSSRRSGVLPSL